MPEQVNFTSYNVNDLVIVLLCCSNLPKVEACNPG
jgi:hypothetical protein